MRQRASIHKGVGILILAPRGLPPGGEGFPPASLPWAWRNVCREPSLLRSHCWLLAPGPLQASLPPPSCCSGRELQGTRPQGFRVPRVEHLGGLECPVARQRGVTGGGGGGVLLPHQHQPSPPAAVLPLVTGEVSVPSDSATQCGSGQGVGGGWPCLALPQHQPRPLSAEVAVGCEGLALAPLQI